MAENETDTIDPRTLIKSDDTPIDPRTLIKKNGTLQSSMSGSTTASQPSPDQSGGQPSGQYTLTPPIDVGTNPTAGTTPVTGSLDQKPEGIGIQNYLERVKDVIDKHKDYINAAVPGGSYIANNAVNSLQTTGAGLQQISDAVDLSTSGHPIQGAVTGTAGLVKTAFGAASAVSPELIGFNTALEQGGHIPIVKDVIPYIASPLSTLLKKTGGVVWVPTGMSGSGQLFDFRNKGWESAAELGDLVWNVLLAHGAKETAVKIKNAEPLTPIDQQHITDAFNNLGNDISGTGITAKTFDKIPPDLPDSKKIDIAPLVKQKQDLEQTNLDLIGKKVTVDDAFHDDIDKQIDANNKEIEKTTTEIQKQVNLKSKTENNEIKTTTGTESRNQPENENEKTTNAENENKAETLKTENDAIQKQSTGEILQREPQKVGESGGERIGVELGKQGKEATAEGKTKEALASEGNNTEPVSQADKEAIRAPIDVVKEEPKAIAPDVFEGKPTDEAELKKWATESGYTNKEAGVNTTFRKFAEDNLDLKESTKDLPDKTAIVTHSKNIMMQNALEELGINSKQELDNALSKGELGKAFLEQKEPDNATTTKELENGKKIYLIRHGETPHDLKDLNSGQSEIGLAKEGKQEVKEENYPTDISNIISSPLERAKQTAEIIKNKINEQRNDTGLRDVAKDSGVVNPKEKTNEPSPEIKNENKTSETKKEATQATDTAGKEERVVEEPEGETGIKNRVTKEERQIRGLPEIEVEVRRNFGKVFDEGKRLVDSGEMDIRTKAKLWSEKPKALNAEESAALLYDRMRLYNEHQTTLDNIIEAIHEGDKGIEQEERLRLARIEDDINVNDKAARLTGHEQGLGLAARRMMIKQDYSQAAIIQRARVANGDAELSEKVRSQLQDLSTQLEAANKKLEQHEAKITNLEAQRVIDRLASDTKLKERKEKRIEKHEDLVKEREKLLEDFKKAANEDEFKTNRLIPLSDKQVAIIAKLARNYVADGLNSIEGIADEIYHNLKDKIDGLSTEDIKKAIANMGLSDVDEVAKKQTSKDPLETYKKRLATKKSELEEKLKSGNFDKTTRQPLALDREAIRLQADVERLKGNIDNRIRQIEMKNRTPFQKAQDIFVAFERAIKLSNPETIAKLFSTGLINMAEAPLAETAGGIWGSIFSGIRDNAERQGGINVDAEAKAMADGFTKGIKDAYDIITKGKSDLEAMYGKGELPPPEILGFFGQLHSATKALTKRNEFTRSLTKRIANNMRNGVDVSDPAVMSKITLDAYKDANASIFLKDNLISDAYQQFVRHLERSKSGLGKPSATALKVLLPFVKVPTNIVRETAIRVGGLPVGLTEGVYYTIKAAITGKQVTPEQSDIIMEHLKKGSLGAAALAIGYFNPDAFGGFYQQGDNKNKHKVKTGALRIGNVEIPRWLLEAPIFQAMQIGATFRHVQDRYSKKKNSSPITEATIQSGLGLWDELPMINEGHQLEKLSSPNGREKFLSSFIKNNTNPILLQKIAEWTDINNGKFQERKTKGFWEDQEAGLPFLREKLKKDNSK